MVHLGVDPDSGESFFAQISTQTVVVLQQCTCNAQADSAGLTTGATTGYCCMDIKFFVIFGMNPITIYTFNGLWKPWILNRWSFKCGDQLTSLKSAMVTNLTDWFGPLAGSLTYTAIIVIFLWSICYWMYRKRIFLKL